VDAGAPAAVAAGLAAPQARGTLRVTTDVDVARLQIAKANATLNFEEVGVYVRPF